MLECEFYLGEAVENDMRYISDRMREVRESFGESQMDFAETLEISRSTVARHEGGLGTISLDYLLRLLRATKTPAEKMFPPDLIPVLVKKVSYLFIAPKVRRELYETAQRAFARCECA